MFIANSDLSIRRLNGVMSYRDKGLNRENTVLLQFNIYLGIEPGVEFVKIRYSCNLTFTWEGGGGGVGGG